MGVVGGHPRTRLAAGGDGAVVGGRGWGLPRGDLADEGRGAEKRRRSRSGRDQVGQGRRVRRRWYLRAGVLFKRRWPQLVADAGWHVVPGGLCTRCGE